MSPVLNVLNGSYFVIKVFDVSDCFSSVFCQIFFPLFLAILSSKNKKKLNFNNYEECYIYQKSKEQKISIKQVNTFETAIIA